MFVNYTNHPSASWGEKQTSEAKKYGEIVDMQFPNISPQMTVQELMKQAKEDGDNIIATVECEENSAVLCQGESVFTYMLVNYLLNKKFKAPRWQSGIRNLKIVSAVSERKVIEIAEGNITQKKSEFCFDGFREYSDGRSVVDTTKLHPSSNEKEFSNSKVVMNDKILITQLGLGGYKNTNYIYPDGSDSKKTGYAFDAVIDKEKPNKLLLIGTSGSGWSDVLEWYSLDLPNEKRKWADEIGKKIAEHKNTFSDWKSIENFIKEAANFEMVKIAIVEPGSTQEQLEKYPEILLNAFKSVVDEKRNTKIIFDISNGFRSMPLYITMFVRYAGLINRSEIEYSMYYGMYEASTNQGTPLVDLSAVSELTDWVNAISEFQGLGSVKGLCECLNREYGKQSDQAKQKQIKYVIRQFEQFDCAWNVNNLYYLENGIKQISTLDTKELPVSETAKLMLNSLRNEFSRRFKKKEKYNYSWLLIRLSELFTEQGRYGVAAVAFQEGFVTYIMERYVKEKILQQLRLNSEKYEKECIHNYHRRTLVKKYWEMKMGTHKKECEIEEIDEFWENYSTIKRKIRNVESHIVYIEEDLPESEEIEKWLRSVQNIMKKDLKSEEKIGFDEVFSDFVLEDVVESKKFLKGEENGKWNLLDEKCLEREKKKRVKTTLENANISLERYRNFKNSYCLFKKNIMKDLI
ncbi:TIGR02221 family CRISPR-associated protein [Firmicutes bacterium AF25-13AC]|nr:TIGR02221 family CRISPR-associated protein [Firmicutes bacterium AF25-13AC]